MEPFGLYYRQPYSVASDSLHLWCYKAYFSFLTDIHLIWENLVHLCHPPPQDFDEIMPLFLVLCHTYGW